MINSPCPLVHTHTTLWRQCAWFKKKSKASGWGSHPSNWSWLKCRSLHPQDICADSIDKMEEMSASLPEERAAMSSLPQIFIIFSTISAFVSTEWRERAVLNSGAWKRLWTIERYSSRFGTLRVNSKLPTLFAVSSLFYGSVRTIWGKQVYW